MIIVSYIRFPFWFSCKFDINYFIIHLYFIVKKKICIHNLCCWGFNDFYFLCWVLIIIFVKYIKHVIKHALMNRITYFLIEFVKSYSIQHLWFHKFIIQIFVFENISWNKKPNITCTNLPFISKSFILKYMMVYVVSIKCIISNKEICNYLDRFY